MSQENKDLKKAIAIGAVWVTTLRLAYRLIGLVSVIFLARLLDPEDFGIAAIAMSIFALINTISTFGFETVIIQLKEPEEDHYNAAWTFNFVFGLVAALFLACFSSSIGGFYNNQDIGVVTLVVSVLFLLNGIKNTAVVDFQKKYDF